MQDKINVILEAAKGWMTSGEIAEKGGWRSAGNVGVCLKQMKDAESRKSPTRKQSNGLPAVEWKLSYKDFDGDQNPIEKQTAGTAKESSAVEMPTDKECCNAARVVATTAGAEVAELRQRIKQLDEANTGLAIESDERKKRIADLEAELGHARIQIDALNEQLMADESIEAVSVEDVAKGYLVCAQKRKPMKLTKPEVAIAKATAAAKATGRCEVFALVPVGVAVRKQVKAVEFKKANAA